MSEPVLEVDDLRTHIVLGRGTVRAVDGVSLKVGPAETLGIVGESGSGKTMTGLSILRLLPKAGGRTVSGRILVDGVDVLELSEAEMARDWRGRRISMVSQDPLTSLNPLFTAGDQVSAPLRYHGLAQGAAALRRAATDLLRRVRIPAPEQRVDAFPHQLSGGMRQRVVSAMAIACSPRVMIADEPTSNLDVTIQVQLMNLYRELQADTGLAIILITHDLGVAASICDRVAVMYAGRIVESGDVRAIFHRAAHPYTQALLASVPHLGRRQGRLYALGGQPPSLIDPPHGCRFAARCAHKMAKCEAEYPPDFDVGGGHVSACWLAEREGASRAA